MDKPELYPEIYTKEGALRKRAPKERICVDCGTKQNQKESKLVKFPGITFLKCGKCFGRLTANPAFEEWYQAKNNK